jgi:hypothetical protein
MSALNGRYDHLLNKARNALRGGRDTWAVQSTGEKVAVALVLNRSDWLHCRSHRARRAGMDQHDPSGCAPACRRGGRMTRSKSIAMAGTYILAAVLLVTPSVQGMALDTIEVVAESAVKGMLQPFWTFEHGKCFTLDRFDPTCPRCL